LRHLEVSSSFLPRGLLPVAGSNINQRNRLPAQKGKNSPSYHAIIKQHDIVNILRHRRSLINPKDIGFGGLYR
jgi:hypothetical protein